MPQNGMSSSGRGHHHHHHHHHQHHHKLSGHKRNSSGSVVGPDCRDSYVKLFVGSVPRSISESEVRSMFQEYGTLLEVALIKDKRTGHQQGCCFVKYSSREEADRAIRCLNNQRTLPGGHSAVQVRYADGERERLGAVEHKLFVGSLNKQASEKEIEEIFAPYGRVDDVYIMRDDHRHSRGCAFIKFPSRDSAQAAIKGLNGVYMMRGCDQPLAVRFADPKKPKTAAESSRSSHSSRPGSGSSSRSSAGGRYSPVHWRSNGGSMRAISQTQTAPSIAHVVSRLSPPHHPVANPFTVEKLATQPVFAAPQGLPLRQVLIQGGTFPQLPQIPQQQQQPPPQQQQHLMFAPPLPEQVPPSVLHLQQMQLAHPPQATFSPLQPIFQPQFNQQQPAQPNQMLILQQNQQPQQQQQQQQQQPQVFQPPPIPQQQQQPPWLIALQPQQLLQAQMLQTSTTQPPLPPPPPSGPAGPCNWTEHVSPEGFKYYYNSVTAESKWEKPDELLKLEQQQQQQPQSLSFPLNSVDLDQFRSQM